MIQNSQVRRPPKCTECVYRESRMFCNLSPKALKDFEKLGVQMMLFRGSVLFREDDRSEGIVIVCSGKVKLSCSSRQGKILIVKIALPGDVLGLGAVLSGTLHETTAETLEPCTVKHIPREEFLAFLERHGQASIHTAKSLAEEYRSAFLDARRLALAPSVAGRVASVLLELGRGSANNSKSEMRFTMALTHGSLANLAGTSRETVTRTLSKFQREKLIQVRGSSMTILDPEKLSMLSS
jgi:CRP/FNR family transcriptional regulator, cyclic AMP receptor protein